MQLLRQLRQMQKQQWSHPLSKQQLLLHQRPPLRRLLLPLSLLLRRK
jgi:hypothetical protein